jgi:WD40 repeat protein
VEASQVHLLDLNGNEVKHFDAHTTAVNELCFDSRGEFVGSCSDDGTVVSLSFVALCVVCRVSV